MLSLQRALRHGGLQRRGLSTVAVTGATGYIGSYVVAELLERGHVVRAFVRGCGSDPGKAAHLEALPGAAERLSVHDGGDLTVAGSFDAGMAGADAVINTAAVVQMTEDPSIATASIDGVRNVLASVDTTPSVKTFVHTSSIASIMTYDKGDGYVFDETDWNDWSTLENGDAYGVGKTTAERIARDHFADDATRHVVAVNPAIVVGPVMTKAHTKASPIFLRDIIYGNPIPNSENGNFVDVRDVAAAHVTAMERARELDGQRFVLVNDHPCVNLLEIGTVAQESFPDYDLTAKPAYPPWKLSLGIALSHVPVVGPKVMTEFQRSIMTTPTNFANVNAKSKLGILFKPLKDTLRDAVRSMVDQGFAKPRPKSSEAHK